MLTNEKQSKLRWACRRGMLELDLLLLPFLENHYANLNEEEKIQFEQLLTCNDQDLYCWLIKREPTFGAEFSLIIKQILQYVAQT